MARRGNNIYHRKDGRWEGRFYCKGSHKYKSVYGKCYTACREKLDRLRNEVLVPSERCHLLVSDIMKLWLESRRPRIKESSYAGYRNKLEKQIVPYFDKLKYSKLDVASLDKFISDKLAEGLSKKYISDMVVMIRSAAKWAETTHHYANLIRNVEMPKVRAKETALFTPDEQKKLISALQKEATHTARGILLTLFSGLRIGEICALRWGDIDFTARVLHVRRTVQRLPV